MFLKKPQHSKRNWNVVCFLHRMVPIIPLSVCISDLILHFKKLIHKSFLIRLTILTLNYFLNILQTGNKALIII